MIIAEAANLPGTIAQVDHHSTRNKTISVDVIPHDPNIGDHSLDQKWYPQHIERTMNLAKSAESIEKELTMQTEYLTYNSY